MDNNEKYLKELELTINKKMIQIKNGNLSKKESKIKPKTISDLQITKKDDSITSVIQKMMKKDDLVNNNLSYLIYLS